MILINHPVDMSMVPIVSQKHMVYVGIPECMWIPTWMRYQLDLAASYVAMRFFDSLQDIRLWVGNGQPPSGT